MTAPPDPDDPPPTDPAPTERLPAPELEPWPGEQVTAVECPHPPGLSAPPQPQERLVDPRAPALRHDRRRPHGLPEEPEHHVPAIEGE